MHTIKEMTEYADDIGGTFNHDDIEAIPYNHWKKDLEWLVLIVEPPSLGAFIPVTAFTPKEAAQKAIDEYLEMKEELDDESSR